MEAAAKTVTVRAAPLGYVYVTPIEALRRDLLALLVARSADDAAAVAPLVRGLTVEAGFAGHVAVVAGARTTGLGGGLTLKLTPNHFHPNVFFFHNGDCVPPSSAAPALSRACEVARARFGFSAYRTPVDNAEETTGAEVCARLGLAADAHAAYLVVADGFKEAVYLCNAFLHYGGAGTVSINGHEAWRVPLYPVHLFMPDVNRLVADPFNAKNRSISEEFVYPRPFFNGPLCRLLHGYVLGPAAVATRVRNLDAVARGAAHLAFDENHESAVLPADVTFTLFEQRRRGGDAAAGGLERRMASVMSADAALSLEALVAAGVYDEEPPALDDWPVLSEAGAKDGGGAAASAGAPVSQAAALGAYVSRAAGLVGALVFSSNSVLYLTEVDDAGAADGGGKEGAGPSFNRFYQVAAPYLAGNPQTDKDGRVLPHTASQPATAPGNHDFAMDHLVMACGFCPQLLARVLFYLERCDAGTFVGRGDVDAVRYVAGSLDAEVPCSLCDRASRPACAHTTLHRLRHRLPRFGAPTRSPMGVFGTMNSAYSDCDVLGNYASYGALKRPNDSEPPKAIMQDTYRAAVDRLLADVAGARIGETVTDHAGFRHALRALRDTVEQAADRFVRTLVETRDFKLRDALYDANHTMSLSLDPYSGALCPATSFLARRTLLAVLQDLALSQCHGVLHGQPVEGRNFRNQFQPVLRRRVVDMLNGGFVTAKTVTVTLADGIVAPDPTKGSAEPPARDHDGDLARVSFEVLRELRVKSRVMFSTGSGSLSDAARARVAGLAGAYQRPDTAVDVLNGPLGFLLKQHHATLFPRGKPPGGQSPNPQWFWTLLQRNQLPARLLTKDDIETIAAVKRFSVDYGAINYVNLTPGTVAELAQFYLANLILRYCDHKQFFINSLTGITMQSKRPRDPAAVMAWVRRPLADAADAERAAREVLDAPRDDTWVATYTSSHLLRSVMASRPLVVLGLGVSKYHGMAGNNRVFQAGNWSGLNGGKHVCPLMVFDRTRHFVLACPRVGFTCSQTGGGAGLHDHSLGEHVKTILADGGPLVQTAVYAAVLHALGARTQHLEPDDWRAIVDDEFLAAALAEINGRVADRDGRWSVEAAAELVRDLEGQTGADGGGEETAFDFGACGAGGDAGAGLAPASLAPAELGGKRPPPEDDLFDMGAPPEKRLTFDML
ncbi:ICP8 [Suid alphaherpesvirus 1]|nr:ICP8 [Suid alphaherpesvirus 1]